MSGLAGSASAAPDLPQPVAKGASVGSSPEVEAALAAMPGMYGLALLDVTLQGDRIEIVAAADCPTTLEVLQSGQWAVTVVQWPAGGASSDAVGGDAGSVDSAAYLAELRLGTLRSEARLVESETACKGSISLPE